MSCEAVVAETCFLLARNGFDPAAPLKKKWPRLSEQFYPER